MTSSIRLRNFVLCGMSVSLSSLRSIKKMRRSSSDSITLSDFKKIWSVYVRRNNVNLYTHLIFSNYPLKDCIDESFSAVVYLCRRRTRLCGFFTTVRIDFFHNCLCVDLDFVLITCWDPLSKVLFREMTSKRWWPATFIVGMDFSSCPRSVLMPE